MEMSGPGHISDAARRLLREHFGKTEYTLVRSETHAHPETGRTLHVVAAVAAERPNERAFELVLDDTGAPVTLAGGAAALLPPSIGAVAAELVEAIKVKIDPARNDLELSTCDTHTETVTVTVPKSAAVAKADIYFLADNTGSMGSVIAAVQAGASSILSSLPPGLQFGVGFYRDFPGSAASVFQNQQPITGNLVAVQAAISVWGASGGGDAPEGQFYALDQIAEPPGGSIGWRPGAKRIIVWFGDAPAHEDICPTISGLSYPINEASVTSQLTTEGIQVLAISTTTGVPGALDGDPKIGNDYVPACGAQSGNLGQASRIAAATSGIHITGINAGTIVSTIINELKALLAIKNLHLEAVGGIVPFVTSITPPGGYGPLASDLEHVLKFEVTFSGDVVDCATRDRVFTGALDVVADGVVVGAKPTRITVPACKFTYGVKFVCGTQADCDCGCTSVRPGAYATEINILNSQCKEAHIVKRIIPVVFAGAAAGREPRVAHPRATDRIVLPPGTATMDDCCRIAELLYGAEPASPMALTVGFLEIVSDQELTVTAVYTASDPKGNGVSIDVQTVPYKLT